jgi:hypothetical protein
VRAIILLSIAFLLFSSGKIKKINNQDEWKEVCISTNCGTGKKIRPFKKKPQTPRRIYPINPKLPFGQKKRNI